MKLFGRDDRVTTMANDPQFLFRVGRLIGASEMVGHVLAAHTDPEVAKMGRIVLDRLTWFPASELALPEIDDEAQTMVKKPAPTTAARQSAARDN